VVYIGTGRGGGLPPLCLAEGAEWGLSGSLKSNQQVWGERLGNDKDEAEGAREPDKA
jgi:hypothetical protein